MVAEVPPTVGAAVSETATPGRAALVLASVTWPTTSPPGTGSQLAVPSRTLSTSQ